jgi:hypothetical protein
LTLVGSAPALAAPTWLSPADVSAASPYSDAARVAMDPAGDAVAVWQHFNGTNQIVEGSVRLAGGSFAAPVDLSAGGVNAQTPQVAMDPAGDAVAVWDRGATVVQAVSRPAGRSFSAPVDISSTSTSVSDAHVAMDQAGDAIAVWRIFDGTNFIVQAAVRPAGGAFGTPVNLTADGNDAFAPDVAMDPAGDATVVWFRYNGTTQVIQAATRPAGGSFATPHDVSLNGGDAAFPHVAMDNAGDAVAVWYRGNGTNNIAQAAVLPAGGTWQTPEDLSAVGENALNAAVGMDPAGDAVAVWQRSDGTNQIVQAAARPAGGSFGSSVDLSAAGENALAPQVAIDQAGDAVATWQRSNGTNVIIQTSTRPAGGTFSLPVDQSATGEDAEFPDVAMDQAGDAIAMWDRSNGTNPVVQAAGYDFAGPQLRNPSIPSSGVAAMPVSFAVSPVDVWSGVPSTTWDFGDGSGGSGSAVSHTYAAAGIYQVSVTSVDGDGNRTTTRGSITILPVHTLAVTVAGPGTVTSNPAGIACPSMCSHNYAQGSVITLTAHPGASSTFQGWSGACSGTGACMVPIGSDQEVTATFKGPPPTCTLAPKGTLRFASDRARVARKHKKKAPTGTLKLTARCNQGAKLQLSGTITARPKRGKTKRFTIAAVHATAGAARAVTLTVHLPRAALAALHAGSRETVVFLLTVSNGTSTASAEIASFGLAR